MKYVYETKLSEHIARDNIGQLICTDVPVSYTHLPGNACP